MPLKEFLKMIKLIIIPVTDTILHRHNPHHTTKPFFSGLDVKLITIHTVVFLCENLNCKGHQTFIWFELKGATH